MLYVSEYGRRFLVPGLPVPPEPCIRTQLVESGSKSEPFSPVTEIIRVHADHDCHVKFGSDPTATPLDTKMSGGSTEFFVVIPGHCVAVVEAE